MSSDRILALVQGLYFAITGIWPWVHLASFERVTGKKHDHWLVQTVGLLLTITGAILILAGLRIYNTTPSGIAPEVVWLAIGSAAAMAWVDIYFVAKKVISKIYLVDAFIELALIAAWLMLHS